MISRIACAQPLIVPIPKSWKHMAAGAVLHCTCSRTDISYQCCQVCWWSPGITQTQQTLHSHFGAWFGIVIWVVRGDAQSVHSDTSPVIALPTHSRSVICQHCSSSFLFIDTSEIWVHCPHTQSEQDYHGTYEAALCAVLLPICTCVTTLIIYQIMHAIVDWRIVHWVWQIVAKASENID
jgi:hypothetical protein